MTDVRVLGFRVDGAPALIQGPLSRLGGVLAQELLNDYALYRLRPEEFKANQGWNYRPARFSIVPDGLQIVLEPEERR